MNLQHSLHCITEISIICPEKISFDLRLTCYAVASRNPKWAPHPIGDGGTMVTFVEFDNTCFVAVLGFVAILFIYCVSKLVGWKVMAYIFYVK